MKRALSIIGLMILPLSAVSGGFADERVPNVGECEKALLALKPSPQDEMYAIFRSPTPGTRPAMLFIPHWNRRSETFKAILTTDGPRTDHGLYSPGKTLAVIELTELPTEKLHYVNNSSYQITRVELLSENSPIRFREGQKLSFDGALWSGWDQGVVRIGRYRPMHYNCSYGNPRSF